MNALGFQEAHEYAIHIRIDDFNLPVCSLPGFVILKLIAMTDRELHQKDTDDIAFIMKNYDLGGASNRVSDEDCIDLLNDESFDYEIFHVRTLGRDMGKILTLKTGNFILNELNNNLKNPDCSLIRSLEKIFSNRENPFIFAKNLITNLKIGIDEILKTKTEE